MTSPRKILVAHEERHVARLLQRTLTRAGHVVHWARDGDEAAKRLASSSFETVIMATELPRVEALRTAIRQVEDQTIEVIELPLPTTRGTF